jgi:hypothetical protein
MGKKLLGQKTIEIYNNLNNHQKLHMLQLILWGDNVNIYQYVKGLGINRFKFEDANLNGAGIDAHIIECDD